MAQKSPAHKSKQGCASLYWSSNLTTHLFTGILFDGHWNLVQTNRIYSDQLRQNVLVKQYYCDIDIAHLISYNEELAHKLTTEPADIIPLVRMAFRLITANSNHLAPL
jgi:DNA replicative helicase MCM subunit Mcm2 (Cdc46/Mcm family)